MAIDRILLVCTGNVCRSPAAEGFLRRDVGSWDRPPEVRSAGTIGWEGSPASPGSVQACAERGVDISGHVARCLTGAMVDEADLIIGMAQEHVDAIGAIDPESLSRTFALKDLVRLLEALPEEGGPEDRVGSAAGLRITSGSRARNVDVADPLGHPIEAYRAVVAELEGLCRRLVDGMAPTRAVRATGSGG